MTMQLKAEVTLLFASRSNCIAMVALFCILLISAVWSGLAAREIRAQQAATMTAARHLIEQTRNDVATRKALPPLEAAIHAHAFGRSDAAPALLDGGGGLALSVSRFSLLSPEARVSVDSRLTDGRRGEGLGNPLLAESGQFDLATTTAIFTPLAALILCAGMIQRERTLGTWRTLCVQAANPFRTFVRRMVLRAFALALATTLASLPAFLIDDTSTWGAFLTWSLVAALYIALWTCLGAALCLPRIQAATALSAGLALWLFTLFVIPLSLQSAAERIYPTPSRLESVITLRASHLKWEEREAELLAAWYEAHPESKAPAVSHTWPVTFIPRHIAFDRELRPSLRAYEDLQAARFLWIEEYAWMAPPLALVFVADRLTGIDSPRYAQFMHAADHHEDAWRELIVPRVMSYEGLLPETVEKVPAFVAPPLSSESPIWIVAAGFASIILILVFATLRRRDEIYQ